MNRNRRSPAARTLRATVSTIAATAAANAVLAVIATSAALTLAAGAANAQTPAPAATATPAVPNTGGASRATIDKLMDLTQAQKMSEGLVDQVQQMMAGTANQMGMQKEDKPVFDKHLKRVVTIARDDMGWAALKPQLAEVYARHYTEEEAQGVIAFYLSPAGQAMLKKSPAMMDDTNKLSQQLMNKSLPKFQKVATEMQAEVAQARTKTAPAGSGPAPATSAAPAAKAPTPAPTKPAPAK